MPAILFPPERSRVSLLLFSRPRLLSPLSLDTLCFLTQAWYVQNLAPGGKRRSKLSSQVVGKGHQMEADKEKGTAATLPLEPVTAVADLDDMKARLPLFPAFRNANPTSPFQGWA